MWNQQNTTSLIEDMHKTPCLWDLRSPEYKQRSKKMEAFVALGKKYEVSPTDIEKKIQALRNQFRREQRKLIDSHGTMMPHKQVSWFGYNRLLFLLESYEPKGKRSKCRRAQDNKNFPSTSSISTEMKKEALEMSSEGESCESLAQRTQTPNDDERMAHISSIVSQRIHSPHHIIHSSFSHSKLQKSQFENADGFLYAPRKLFHSSNSEYDQIALVWANELQKMDPQQQIFAKKAINEILFEGQMGTLHRNFMAVNSLPACSATPTKEDNIKCADVTPEN